mgnify:CR=1 FL=1
MRITMSGLETLDKFTLYGRCEKNTVTAYVFEWDKDRKTATLAHSHQMTAEEFCAHLTHLPDFELTSA